MLPLTLALDADRRLALAYAAPDLRPALEALWRLDVTFGSVLASGRDAMVTRIRLAWWREALQRLDQASPPAEPVLQALAAYLLPAGVTGAELAAMEEGWAALAEPGAISSEGLDLFARARGERLFRLSAKLLGREDFMVDASGRAWALIDFARRATDAREIAAARSAAAALALPRRWPPALRPLGMLAVLARRDAWKGLGQPGSPSRMLRMLGHRITGR